MNPTSLANYRILDKLGAGGMGVVYRAEDTKLRRQVAIKVLPEAFAHDAERMKRFEREARALASLNHPNVAAIHGLEEADGQRFLVLELAEGEDLAERLARGAIPVDEAIGIARQMAEGLEHAHEKGIVHRDLKPANVKLSSDGVVKILDFGLAKALAGETDEIAEGDQSQSPTLSRPATVAGVILGTAAYMSPEQARGRTVDRRADVWAFGVVLYEMVSGRKLFSGETVSDVLAAVLTRAPDFDALPQATPPAIRRLLRRCLERDPKKRLRDIGDARLELEEARAATADIPGMGGQRRALPLALAFVATAAAGALLAWALARPPHASPRVVRSMLAGADGQPIRVHVHTTGRSLLLSPDGSRVVYVPDRGNSNDLAVQSLSDFVAQPLPNPGGHAHPLTFSPDGSSILFTRSDSGLYRMGLAPGSRLQRLCDTSTIVWGAVWLPDDTIVFAAGEPSSLHRVPAREGTARPLTIAGNWDLRWASALPGGEQVLVAASPADRSRASDIAVVSLESGEVRVVWPGGTMPQYIPTGHLVFSAENQVRAVRFDPDTGAAAGAAVGLIDGVEETTLVRSANYALSLGGDLVYLSGSGGNQPVWVDRRGRETPLEIERGRYQEPRISPDGARVAFADASGQWDFVVWDEIRETLTRVPRSEGYGGNASPLWAPDGRELLYTNGLYTQSHLLRRSADGAAAPVDLNVPGVKASSWSPDGKTLLLFSYRPTNLDLLTLSIAGSGEAEPLLATPSDEYGATLSPNGRWLAYMSNESGRFEAYVRPFPKVDDGKWLISTEGGAFPRWTRGGQEIVYRSGTKMMAVAVNAGTSFVPGRPEVLWDTAYFTREPLPLRDFDVSSDGERFLFLRQEGGISLYLVQNWSEEVKAKVGAAP